MRSTNKRSRSKSNRPKTLGNIVNRVFDSSGPEGKVRGTPQQIIEKYQVLARDAQLSNDRVAAENFQQHAEHYTRMLAQATREMQAEQDARRQSQDDRNRHFQDDRRQNHDERGPNQQRHQPQRAQHEDEAGQRAKPQFAENSRHDLDKSAFSVQDFDDTGADDAVLVETPESLSTAESVTAEAPPAEPARVQKPMVQESDAPAPRQDKPVNRRKPRAPKPAESAAPEQAATEAQAEQGTKPKRVQRKPRKAPAETTEGTGQQTPSAAE
ncbi:MAG: DUF4167 domain-containing protein [Roseinatronobacter sp.]|nr:DUF4167 domain-containing protein [Roseinatronobacter sp.]